MFGDRSEVDPVRHLIEARCFGAAFPRKTPSISTSRRPITTVPPFTSSTSRDVPVDGFWSITVYNDKGYLETQSVQCLFLNNITAKKNADGSVAVQFGGCDGTIPNCLPTMLGWNYMVRLYRPRAEALNDTWKFPEAQRVN